MPDQCDNCRFYRPRDYGTRAPPMVTPAATKIVYECRQLSPQRPSGTLAWWPQVEATDWCGQYRSVDAEVLYVQGQGTSTDNGLYPLLVSTDPKYPVVSLRSLQIVNQAALTALIGLYDGNDINMPLGFAGAAGNQVNSYNYDPGILTSPGNDLYFSLQQGNGPVNVAAQGRELPAPGG